MNDPTHPGARYLVSYDDVQRVQAALPPNTRRRPRVLDRAIRDAIVRLRDAGEDDAPGFLARRLTAYFASSEGRSRFRRDVHNWLDEDSWEEPEEAWRGRDEPDEDDRKNPWTGEAM